jgi:hypothetical protein
MGEVNVNRYDPVEQPDGSYIFPDGAQRWYNDSGLRHKEDGPAVINSNGIHWYINGTKYSFNDWLKQAPITDEAKMLLRLQYE